MKASELLTRMRDGESPRAINIKYGWQFDIDGVPCTRAANTLIRKGYISILAMSGGVAAVNLTEKGEEDTSPDLAAIKKIGYQFGSTPEHRLHFAVVGQAIRDLTDKSPNIRGSAKSYLRGPIQNAALCGVESDWIRLVLKKCGVSIA